jgi:transcriptional regulator with XRE-family HTH domain
MSHAIKVRRKPGRPQNVARRRQAAQLRSQGLSLRQVGQRLGISRQAVAILLQRSGIGAGPPRKLHLCRHCRKPVAPTDSPTSYCWAGDEPICLACIGKQPGASFGQRLRAARQAAGISGRMLAAQIGVCVNTVFGWESGLQQPRPAKIDRVAAALGPALGRFLTSSRRSALPRTRAS